MPKVPVLALHRCTHHAGATEIRHRKVPTGHLVQQLQRRGLGRYDLPWANPTKTVLKQSMMVNYCCNMLYIVISCYIFLGVAVLGFDSAINGRKTRVPHPIGMVRHSHAKVPMPAPARMHSGWRLSCFGFPNLNQPSLEFLGRKPERFPSTGCIKWSGFLIFKAGAWSPTTF